MGLSYQSTGLGAFKESYQLQVNLPGNLVVALAGYPNTGKSTLFNSLTGMRQHTGNWPGKTVASARGIFHHRGKNFTLVDLPGTYSLLANSVEEEVARDFICFAQPDATVVVADATCLERNLNLVLQVLEITGKVIVCVNLIDEAKRKKIQINLEKLSRLLGVPVVGTNARAGQGLPELKEAIFNVALGEIKTEPLRIEYEEKFEKTIALLEPGLKDKLSRQISIRWVALRLIDGDKTLLEYLKRYLEVDLLKNGKLQAALIESKQRLESDAEDQDTLDTMVTSIVRLAEQIGTEVVTYENMQYNRLDRKIDDLLTSRMWGIPIMVALLGVVFWITITGANYPAELLAEGFFRIEEQFTTRLLSAGAPDWLHGMLVLGIYRTLSWVVSVMLPPMAIFFPLFTLLEDLGYLPRVAFNLDNLFKKACAHGKQALTMCMGFGCNAAGVIACRIIDSPRERLIATVTNNFVPCNGRFPILIGLSAIFIGGSFGAFQSAAAAAVVLGTVLFGVMITLTVSKLLSKTILKGLPSSFALELPPYRKPQVGRILIRSILDRTLFVLGRAVVVAAPAGLIIWLMANIQLGDPSLLDHGAGFLQPFGHMLGMDGYILMAFILGLPANEIVIPVIIMSYLAAGSMLELASLEDLRQLLISNGWTWLTAVCTMLFALNHFPCGTTLLTISKETRSIKWTVVSFIVPTLTGIVVCFVVAQAVRILGLL